MVRQRQPSRRAAPLPPPLRASTHQLTFPCARVYVSAELNQTMQFAHSGSLPEAYGSNLRAFVDKVQSQTEQIEKSCTSEMPLPYM